MSGITTHVLDTANGRPAAGVPITLERRNGDAWTQIGSGVTDADGRLRTLTGPDIDTGTYRITFDTRSYFPDGFFPETSIVFDVRDAAQHYHVPLLLSPFGYSTYRGS
jgi:5-hydroxyisourate hydrolase